MKTKSWTVYDGSLFGRGLDGHPLNVMLDHDLYYRVSPGDDPQGVDRLLAVLNCGAEAAGYIHAAKAIAKAIEADIAIWEGDCDEPAYARIGFPRAVFDALALMPAGWDEDEKNARIDATERHVAEAEIKFQESGDELTKAKDDLAKARR